MIQWLKRLIGKEEIETSLDWMTSVYYVPETDTLEIGIVPECDYIMLGDLKEYDAVYLGEL